MDLQNVQTLNDLKTAAESFHGCALRPFATRTVFADGVPGAPVMLIGEAPGAQEDALGKPFVGRSGQLLDKMLASINLSRADNAYITNTVFWRPPDNRTPTPDEILSCRPFLLKHIELAKPEVLVLVGATAARAVLQKPVSMGNLRQKWLEFEVAERHIPMLATFHPAYLLRNPPAKKDAWEDLKMLHTRLAALGVVPNDLPQRNAS